MKIKIEIDVEVPSNVPMCGVVDAMSVAIESVGCHVESLSATDGHILIRKAIHDQATE